VVTLGDLKAEVWRSLPVRKHLAGRKTVEDLVELAVYSWEGRTLANCADHDARLAVCDDILRSVKRGYQVVSGREVQEYGIFWTLVLQGVAALVVQLILRWWLDSRMNRVRIEVWQSELQR
jgi:hypothetical protein